MKVQMDVFARRLLLAPELLPADWQAWSPERLAAHCGVPESVAALHLATRST
jgi:hypothetical protein